MPKPAVTVYEYAACSTCKKALKWLDGHGVAYVAKPIVASPPSRAELRAMVVASGLPLRKFINTSGGSYRDLIAARGKAAVEALDDESLLGLLAADGKMIKRPLIKAGATVLVGFREQDYAAAFSR
jgi:arsenate reductase